MRALPKPISPPRLLTHMIREQELSSTVFGVSPGYRAAGEGVRLLGGRLELPLGPAAGPHTRTAQGLVAGYVSGARFFPLPADHTEEALAEYVKGAFAMKLLARELGLGDPEGFLLHMSLPGDPEALRSDAVRRVTQVMEDASRHPAWEACRQAALELLHHFNNVDEDYIRALSPVLSRSATLFFSPEEPAAAVEAAGRCCLKELGLHVLVRVEEPAAETWAGALTTLRGEAEALGLDLGARLGGSPNTQRGVAFARRLTDLCPGLPMAYAGGADYWNAKALTAAGLWPVTVRATLLKPGGFLRFRQIAKSMQGAAVGPWRGPDPARFDDILRNVPQAAPARREKIPRRAPMLDCFTAPCQEGCPFGQDIAGALRLISDGRYRDALRLILDRNPLPNVTAAVCPAFCRSYCTRLLYEEAIGIREAQGLAVERAWEDMLARLEPGEPLVGQRVAILGGGAAGLACALLLRRRGVPITLFEREETLGGALVTVAREKPETARALERDLGLLEIMEADVRLGWTPTAPEQVLKSGYSHVLVATGEPYAPPAGLEEHILPVGKAAGAPFGVAHAIADAHRAVDRLLGPARPHPHPAGRRGAAMGKKGKLRRPGSAEGECDRCLECGTVCEACVDVCPSRANVPIVVLTRARPQVLHLDALCRDCGACAPCCPFESAPSREKFTLFDTLERFERSENPGFVVLDFLSRRVRVRLSGAVLEASLRHADTPIPSDVQELMETVFADYSYLLERPVKGPGAPEEI